MSLEFLQQGFAFHWEKVVYWKDSWFFYHPIQQIWLSNVDVTIWSRGGEVEKRSKSFL